MEDNILTTLLMPLSLALIMMGLGLTLTLDDFKRIIQYPKAVALGLFNQIILLPIVGFGICLIFNPSPLMAVGIMLIASCPAGPTSNLISYISKGDVALSISLTALASFITIFSIPIILSWSLNYFLSVDQSIQLPILDTIYRVLLITLIPAAIGMMINYKFPEFSKKMDRPSRILSTVIYVLIILGIILANKDRLLEQLILNGPPTAFLNISTMALGFLLAMLFGLSLRQRITITVESGIQNGTLAIVIAASILKNIDIGIPAAIYGLIMFVSGGVMMITFGRRKAITQA